MWIGVFGNMFFLERRKIQQEIVPGENEDGEGIPIFNPTCPACGAKFYDSIENIILSSNALTYTPAGWASDMWRIRVRIQCKCGKKTMYRLAFVVKDTHMTYAEIKDDADMAETYPGSGELNWGEVGFKTLVAWVASHSHQGKTKTYDFDVESVKGMFEKWWKEQNRKDGAK
jgi:hypothetical protein